MSEYVFRKRLDSDVPTTIEQVTEALAERGFGVLTTIDVKATMKKKLDEDVDPYVILGACSPSHALRALRAEPYIGAMLPCNVVVRAVDGGSEVAAVDPVASMSAVENPALGDIAEEVREQLREMVESL